jgi:hypothetical protein
MPSCQHADARWLSSHPRMRADGRTVPFSRSGARHMAPGRSRDVCGAQRCYAVGAAGGGGACGDRLLRGAGDMIARNGTGRDPA